jgi:hypothetical protein
VSCLLWLVVIWHLALATREILIANVHYDWKWATNLIVIFQISSNIFNEKIMRKEKGETSQAIREDATLMTKF